MTEHVVGKDRGEVKLGEHSWRVKPMTRSAAKATSMIKTDVGDSPSFEQIDEQALALIGYIDKRLTGESSAGDVLESMWKGDDIGVDDLAAIAEFLAPSENGSGPPQ